MDIVTRAKNMITNPKVEWDVVAAEQPNTSRIIMQYVLPLTVLGAIAAFIGYGLIGFSILGVHVGGVSWGIYYAIDKIVIGILSVFITAYVVDLLAPSFGSEKNLGRSIQLVSYGGTPALLAAIFAILPFIAGIVAIAGAVYSVYLWYLGLGPIKKTPEDKKVAYLIVAFLVLIVVYFLIGMILSRLLWPVFGIGYGSYGSYGM
ncbi:MAG TPA: Yip1 family protein [Parafilimonas sp.]|nr:Yip1 family protein [Parafilimonas sp.]